MQHKTNINFETVTYAFFFSNPAFITWCHSFKCFHGIQGFSLETQVLGKIEAKMKFI